MHAQITEERDKGRIRQLKAKRHAHIAEVIKDRRVYHSWRKKCRDEPDKYMCIILDGMDQSKTDIPNFNTGETPVQLTCRVVGAIVHSSTKDAYAYVVSHFTKETNTMVEVLRRVLDSRESLPPTLVLQLDNTWQENKNARMFSYLASLVECGVFEEIIVNFLPVGHTHVCIHADFISLPIHHCIFCYILCLVYENSVTVLVHILQCLTIHHHCPKIYAVC